MKKILSIIILGVLLLSVIGGVANAQPQTLKEYCALGSTVRISSGKVLKNGDITVGGASVGCVLNITPDGTKTKVAVNDSCSKTKPCYFQNGCTIGKTAETFGAVTDSAPDGAVTDSAPEKKVDAAIDSWGMVCLLNTINNITNWLFYLLIVAVVLMGVIGGVLYMTSAGDAEKAGKGKSVIIYAIIGLVLALIARLVPSVVRMIVGM